MLYELIHRLALVESHMSCNLTYTGEPGSSVSIVSGYCLDDREIEVRSLAEAKGLYL
jgi:hypothetical protein